MCIRISVHVQVCKECVYVWSIMYCMQHDPNIVLAPMRFFSRCFAHGCVKPIVNSTKWTQRAVKRKAFEHGAKSMVRESAIGVVEIARCLLSIQAKSAGPQRTTLPCFCLILLGSVFAQIQVFGTNLSEIVGNMLGSCGHRFAQARI